MATYAKTNTENPSSDVFHLPKSNLTSLNVFFPFRKREKNLVIKGLKRQMENGESPGERPSERLGHEKI